jgi:hypothetical protein
MASNAIVRTWESIAAVARNLNIPIHEVNAVLQNKTDSAGGFKWEYALAGTGKYCKECVFLCGVAVVCMCKLSCNWNWRERGASDLPCKCCCGWCSLRGCAVRS